MGESPERHSGSSAEQLELESLRAEIIKAIGLAKGGDREYFPDNFDIARLAAGDLNIWKKARKGILQTEFHRWKFQLMESEGRPQPGKEAGSRAQFSNFLTAILELCDIKIGKSRSEAGYRLPKAFIKN